MLRNRVVLIVLDGFGIGKDYPFNAIQNAKMPNYRSFLKRFPHGKVLTHGAAVGLPDGIMGNSEVGHMTMGAGRIIYQDLVRINHSIQDRSFFQNPVLTRTLKTGAETSGRVHLMGLLSDGGVHSHIDHLLALLDFCVEKSVPHVFVHAFLDGRDTPPKSSPVYVEKLLRHPAFTENAGATRATLATVMGRYWAMDRDQRWERIEKAYAALTGQIAPVSQRALEAIQRSHDSGKTDEFLEPVLLDSDGALRDGDGLVFFNYRSDRARQISAHVLKSKKYKPSAFAGMTQYDITLPLPAAFEPQNLKNIFPAHLSALKLRQFRVAETEKYAHVTFFFNGGVEAPFAGEERELIPSPKDVATYDLKPEMSARPVTDTLIRHIESNAHDFILVNYANADMVGHTGNYPAAIQAMEVIDECLGRVVGAALKERTHVFLTADHGNIEEMCDERGEPHTQHTLNPVPAVWMSPEPVNAPKKHRSSLIDGGLADIAPTLCSIMGLNVPDEFTGRSLLAPQHTEGN